MKTIITATIVIVILVASLGATLMIGAPAVYANQADTEQEAGIASDSNGVPCTFGPNHDKCRAEVSASGDDASSLPKLPPGEHYGQCEEVGHDNELGCDVINESDLPNGYKQGIADAKHDRFAGDEITNRTGDYMDGYILGYCSVNHTAPINIGGRNCSLPLYPGN